ncbi:TonB-dependent receptor plug domain-containing protein [Peristeroidobacter agariperforans]|uniref:TonB-dependent receptor plug domain-containing protein n=1 Tax=Peristeroidobacter agariperforans TaxID=268404 RepID=UPI001E5D4A71|nr:TonB-dependent receptor [Peristeroidobacter agariperforans]
MRALLSAGAATLASAGAVADGRDLDALSLEQLMDMNVHVVYGASKYEQRVTQAPSSISLVTAEDIRRFGYTDLVDVLRSVRGLYVTDDRNYTYLGVRGFLRPGDYNTRVLVLIDGHRLNDNVYDSGSVGRDSMLDVELIDRVEVIRGPSSSLYGSSAFFGVINVITKRGRGVDGGELEVDTASYDTQRARATYGKTFDSGVDWLVSMSHYSSDGLDFYYPEFDQRISADARAAKNGLAAGRDDENASKFFSSLRYGNFAASLYLSDRHKQIPTASFDTIFDDPRTMTDDARGYLELSYNRALSERASLSVRASYDSYQYEGDFPTDYALLGEGDYEAIARDEMRGEWLNSEVQLTLLPTDRYTVIMGAEYRTSLREYQAAYDVIEPRVYYIDRDDTSSVLGLFGQVEAKLRDDFSLTAGLRYDHYGQTFGGTANPRLAAVYNPSPNSAIKALYGEAFRAPNPYEAHYNPEQANRPPLRPETIDTYELVYEHYFNSTYRLSLSGYQYQIDGLITLVETEDGEPYFDNLEDVQARGVELELEGSYSNGAVLRGSWSVQRAKDTATGLELTNSPRQLGKLSASTPILNSKVFANLELQYNSETVTLARTHSPSYWITNFTLNSHDRWSKMELTAGIYNAFDEERLFPGSEEHAQTLLQQQGRTYGAEVIVRF